MKGGGRKPLDPELFGKMKKWYEECRRNGIKPNTLEISKKAIQISRIEEFKGSKGWVSKFLDYMKRNGTKLDDDLKELGDELEEEKDVLMQEINKSEEQQPSIKEEETERKEEISKNNQTFEIIEKIVL